jgi:hypothetical protein
VVQNFKKAKVRSCHGTSSPFLYRNSSIKSLSQGPPLVQTLCPTADGTELLLVQYETAYNLLMFTCWCIFLSFSNWCAGSSSIVQNFLLGCSICTHVETTFNQTCYYFLFIAIHGVVCDGDKSCCPCFTLRPFPASTRWSPTASSEHLVRIFSLEVLLVQSWTSTVDALMCNAFHLYIVSSSTCGKRIKNSRKCSVA